jgi:hypothetical protein
VDLDQVICFLYTSFYKNLGACPRIEAVARGSHFESISLVI